MYQYMNATQFHVGDFLFKLSQVITSGIESTVCGIPNHILVFNRYACRFLKWTHPMLSV